VRFVVAGEKGTHYQTLVTLLQDLGIEEHVTFLGIISEAEKIRLMQSAKIYLQPSLYEGFGLAILEAMSCGAAVVSSPVGAVPEVVGDAGLLVDGRSPEQIAGAVIRLLDDENLRAHLGDRAAERARRLFPRERRRRELEHIVSAVLAGRAVRLESWSSNNR
jgi:glycosyltransferase involved in cell wall biosynthesis